MDSSTHYKMSQIIDNLWLGHEDDAKVEGRYDMVVNCTTDLPFYDQKAKQIRIEVKDNGNSEQIEILKGSIVSVLELVEESLKSGQKVLIHCQAGQSRSPTVIACYLLYTGKVSTVDEAIGYLKARASNAFFGQAFFRPVMEHIAGHKDQLGLASVKCQS
jgi:protein-tyrosine phosphatase